jgi:cell division protein FtsB
MARAPFSWRLQLRWRSSLVIIGLGLFLYFGYHAVNGSRGLLASQQLSTELATAEKELAALEAEHADLAWKVRHLRHDAVDPDLLDELARDSLSLVEPMDVIILMDGEESDR